MTEAFHVGKTRKEWPADTVLADKGWGKLFDPANEYQAVIIEFIDAGDEFPIAGMGLNCTLRARRAAASQPGDGGRRIQRLGTRADDRKDAWARDSRRGARRDRPLV
ncbi:MAG: hypothetical protein WA459_06940 [Stellaceae bacterium]